MKLVAQAINDYATHGKIFTKKNDDSNSSYFGFPTRKDVKDLYMVRGSLVTNDMLNILTVDLKIGFIYLTISKLRRKLNGKGLNRALS